MTSWLKVLTYSNLGMFLEKIHNKDNQDGEDSSGVTV